MSYALEAYLTSVFQNDSLLTAMLGKRPDNVASVFPYHHRDVQNPNYPIITIARFGSRLDSTKFGDTMYATLMDAPRLAICAWSKNNADEAIAVMQRVREIIKPPEFAPGNANFAGFKITERLFRDDLFDEVISAYHVHGEFDCWVLEKFGNPQVIGVPVTPTPPVSSSTTRTITYSGPSQIPYADTSGLVQVNLTVDTPNNTVFADNSTAPGDVNALLTALASALLTTAPYLTSATVVGSTVVVVSPASFLTIDVIPNSGRAANPVASFTVNFGGAPSAGQSVTITINGTATVVTFAGTETTLALVVQAIVNVLAPRTDIYMTWAVGDPQFGLYQPDDPTPFAISVASSPGCPVTLSLHAANVAASGHFVVQPTLTVS